MHEPLLVFNNILYAFLINAGLANKIFPLTFEEDFLVQPLDVADFSSHRDCVAAVLKHFGKVK